ncbi:spore coat protein H [Entomortierella parvispora]|uniref:Spore coat protein H n=1 Tax=Entomortierella parvispora TaxID=205924 RepID=A0A9P3H3B4_9FUNG|nr:spore coat protein H [Entomortierella parvispora]
MKILLGLAALASVAYADITFNVVGYPSTANGAFGVSIGGKVTLLKTNETMFPVWSGAIPGTTSAVEYSYVELASSTSDTVVKTEPFVRKLQDPKETSTDNEFFERQTTVWDLPKVPYTYLATFPSASKAFKEKQIATIHITAPKAQMDEMNKNTQGQEEYQVDFRFINAKTIHSQRNITFKLSGKSSREHSKQAYKFKFDTTSAETGGADQSFFHRPNIKLRSMVMDPTCMREKLYIDMLNSVGVPTQQGAWVRLFVNNEPRGLYLMVDDIKKSFLKQTVHGGNGTVERGTLIQMNAYEEDNGKAFKADLVYKGPLSADYPSYAYLEGYLGKNSPSTKAEPLKEIIDFMKDLQDFNPQTTPNPVEYINSRLDLDGFLRNMALEYLAGAFDNYWFSASNYFMYKNPTLSAAGKWQWLPTDFDGTFGNGAPSSTLDSYKKWNDELNTGKADHPLVGKLILQNKEINAQFEKILQEIVQTAFKPEALLPRIQAYHKMLYLDAQWDYSLKRVSPGLDNGYTFDDFKNNLDTRTKDMSYSLNGWVTDMAALVAKELNFVIPAGLEDRVKPPPKKDNEAGNDQEDSGKKGESKGKENAAGALQVSSAAFSAAVLAVVALLI